MQNLKRQQVACVLYTCVIRTRWKLLFRERESSVTVTFDISVCVYVQLERLLLLFYEDSEHNKHKSVSNGISVDWRQENWNGEDVKFKTRSQTRHGAPRQQGTESFSLEGGSGPRRAARPLTSASVKLRTAPPPPPPHLLPNIECHTESARDRDLRCNQRRGNGFAAGFAAAGHMPPCACERANWLCEVIGRPGPEHELARVRRAATREPHPLVSTSRENFALLLSILPVIEHHVCLLLFFFLF